MTRLILGTAWDGNADLRSYVVAVASTLAVPGMAVANSFD